MDFLFKILFVILLNELVSGSGHQKESQVQRSFHDTISKRKSKDNANDGHLIRYQAQEDSGYYKFGYAIDDGQYRVEEGSPQEGILGSYGYIGTDGKEVKVFYKADHQGFQILTADAYKVLSNAKKLYNSQNAHSIVNLNKPIQHDYSFANGNIGNDENYHQTETYPTTTIEDYGIKIPKQIPLIRNTNGISLMPDIQEVQGRPPQFPIFRPYSNQYPFHFSKPVPSNGFVNHIPGSYFPYFGYDHLLTNYRFRFVPSSKQFSPLVIRVN